MKTVDMHCDTISRLYRLNADGNRTTLLKNELQIDIEKLTRGNYLIQNFAMFLDAGASVSPKQDCIDLIHYYKGLMEEYPEVFQTILTYGDIESLGKNDKIGSFLTMEEGAPIEGKVENLEEFYRMGVRMLTLTWNYPNEIGYPNIDMSVPREQIDVRRADTVRGLTERGRDIVQAMETAGMIIDVSHGSDALFYDVLECTKKPFVASHSNSRAVCDIARNLTDDMIHKLSGRGGVMGMNFCSDFVTREGGAVTYAKDVVRHMLHIKNVGGIECIGLGSDFDGIENEVEWKDASGMELLYHEMKKAGFTDSETEAVFSGNVLRVYREIL